MCKVSDIPNMIIDEKNEFFDFNCIDKNVYITDYHYMNKEFVLSEYEGNECDIEIGGEKKRTRATSIDELKNVFKGLVRKVIYSYKYNTVLEYLPSSVSYESGGIVIKPKDMFYEIEEPLLVNQLIFDILVDKYLKEAEEMTRFGYSKYISKMLSDDNYLLTEGINKALERGMKQYYDMMRYSQLRGQLVMLSIIPDKYAEYYNPKMEDNLEKKKPKYVWDYLYYNHNQNFYFDDEDFDSKKHRGTITYRQYRRQLTREGRNYSYGDFVDELNKHKEFVRKLLPNDNEQPKKYFVKLMDYYLLESYKRIDFIFKLINVLPQLDGTEIKKEHFLVRRFYPLVLIPYEKENKLEFGYKYKYYRPLFLIEDIIQEKMVKDNLNQVFYEDLLSRYQYVRARAYELFKYHYEYISSDYKDIKDFICQSYNMRSYHESNDIWEIIEGKQWINMDKETQKTIKMLNKHFLSINEALFWRSTDREINIPPNK